MKRLLTDFRYMLCLQGLILFGVLWGVWYVNYYYHLWWLEGYSYFTTLPDFAVIQAQFPDDALKYVGAFLLQLFYEPIWGAAIQAGFAVWIFLCGAMIVGCLFKSAVKMLWLAALPLPFFVVGQFWDLSLERSIGWCLVALGMAVAVWIVARLKKFAWIPKKMLCHLIVRMVVPILSLCLSVYFLIGFDKGYQNQEMFGRLEYYGEHKRWNEILKVVTPQAAQRNQLLRTYALLALAETGRLPDYMLRYGITNSNEFLFFNREVPFCRNFNSLFYRSVGLPNEVIHQCYQMGIQSSFGFSFAELRRLVDTYLEIGDYPLAQKYMEVLSYSTFQNEWIKERMPRLEAIKETSPNYRMVSEAFTVDTFLETMSSVYDRSPDNRMYADLLLCGILADKNGTQFYQVFQIIAKHLFAKGERIPRYYEEALLLVSSHEKEVLTQYAISKESRERFQDFMQMAKSNRLSAAKRKYPDSYWTYVF